MANDLKEDLEIIIRSEKEQIDNIQSDFLRKRAKEIRRMAEV